MDIRKDLKDALKDVEAAKITVANELDKGENLNFVYTKIQGAEQKLKRAIANLDKEIAKK